MLCDGKIIFLCTTTLIYTVSSGSSFQMWILLAFLALLGFLYWYTYPRLGEILLAAYVKRAMQQARLVRRRYSINGISLSVLETEGSHG